MVIIRRIALLLLALIANRLDAQTTPSTPPTISFSATATSTDWLTGANWIPARVPTINDDVGIGFNKTATLNAFASARTVTLGEGAGPNYTPGKLIVAPPVPSGTPT
ncbi:MAG: hypothetical protein JOY96_10475, partial [Verrucomicrobia bacterium]|nr:hypothetical protein [Verrucomicrobiota bacterium]